jgi:GTP-binding protein YchF
MAGKFVSEFEMTEEELKLVKSFCFLTQKPMLYIANVCEEDLFDLSANSHYETLCQYAKEHGSKVIPVCAELEAQLSEFDAEERESYLNDLGITESGLDTLIKEAYDLLGLATFFTAGEKEVRAWTFKKGMKAPQCAGVIHTDFEKGFIRAEVVSYDDLVKDGSLVNAKSLGHVRQEGKEYLFKDGDVTLFKFNVTK